MPPPLESRTTACTEHQQHKARAHTHTHAHAQIEHETATNKRDRWEAAKEYERRVQLKQKRGRLRNERGKLKRSALTPRLRFIVIIVELVIVPWWFVWYLKIPWRFHVCRGRFAWRNSFRRRSRQTRNKPTILRLQQERRWDIYEDDLDSPVNGSS